MFLGFHYGSAGKESACNVGDLGLIPGLGRSPWGRERLPTPVCEFHGLYSPWGCTELDMTEQLSLTFTQTFYRAKQNKPENLNKQINKKPFTTTKKKKKKEKEKSTTRIMIL